MGGNNSKQDFYDDSALMAKVQNDQQVIMERNTKLISEFFASVDSTVMLGAANNNQIDKLEKDEADKLKVLQDNQQKLEDEASKGAHAKPEHPPQDEAKVAHKSADNVLVILNQASVFYSQTSENSPKVLKGLTDLASNVINDLLGKAKAGEDVEQKSADGEAKPAANTKTAADAGAKMQGSALISAFKTLFATETAVTAAIQGVTGAVKILLSSMESNVTLSSSLQKKIQFVAPGLYCATYYSASTFTFKDSRKTLTYNLNCGGIYLVTSVKLVQTLAALEMYKTVCDSFEHKLQKCQAQLDQFVEVYNDLSLMSGTFGFDTEFYDSLMKDVKTPAMRSFVQNFWHVYKEKDMEVRTTKWTTFVDSGRLKSTVDNCKSSYEIAFKDLREYYDKFVLHPIKI